MSKNCCVPQCSLRRTANTILHKFPDPEKELERFNDWRNAIGENVANMEPQFVYRCRRVCHKHFESQYYTRSRMLAHNAVPSLHLSGNISYSGRQPFQDITQRILDANPISIGSPSFLLTTANQPSTSYPANQPSTSYQPISKDVKPKKNIMGAPDVAVLSNKIRQLQKAKTTAVNKIKKLLTLSDNPVIKKTLSKLSTTALIFTMLQLRESGKSIVGGRFTKKEKLLALALYKQGPRAYRWMRKWTAVLPSPLTLNRLIRKAALKPGINENIFGQLRKKVRKMNQKEKICILMFDEIALSPHLDYNHKNDCITGFVDSGIRRKNKIADHALVFMIRGVLKNYKQPLFYSFCAKTTTKEELMEQIKLTIGRLLNIGFNVIATVSDQGATNVGAINYLINERKGKLTALNEEPRYSTFEIDGHEIIPLYDPPHLIKCIRNNLLNKDLQCKMNGAELTAKWDHIIKLYNCDSPFEGLRLVPKLTDRHVIPQKIYKMKVKCATQVFSSTVALHMGMMTKFGSLPEECYQTMKIITFFDNLFDSFNGSHNKFEEKGAKPLLGPVTEHSNHKQVWAEAKPILKSMRFVKNGKSVSVPSIQHWLMTVENVQYLIAKLSQNHDLTPVWMRHFNQDPLENFFGGVRSHGYRNTSPTCAGFEAAFTSLLVNTLSNSHSPGANCEKDACRGFSLGAIFFNDHKISNPPFELDFDDIMNFEFNVLENKIKNTKIKAQIEYVSGYILRKLKRKVFKNCETCKKDFYNENREDSELIAREYFKNKFCLVYPCTNILRCFSNIQDVIINLIRKHCTKNNLKEYIKTVLAAVMNYNFVSCEKHKKDFINEIENICIDFFIRNWCKDCNKILNGSRSEFERNDNIQILCAEYYAKSKK